MEIPSGVYDVLADPRTVIADNRVQIPFQLDPARYEQVKKVLREIGGRWDGRKTVRAHVFPFPVEEFMRACLAAREFPSRYEQGWYPTPTRVVDEMLAHAGIREGMRVLEPSAGTGSIVGPATECGAVVDCVEIDERRVHVLREQGAARRVVHADFLDLDPLDSPHGYQRVLMNPPFSTAVRHVKHALGFLDDDGTLIAVMPETVMWHSDRATAEFRELVARAGGTFAPLPEEAFAPSGVRVRTVLLVVDAEPGGPLPTRGWRQRQPRQLDLFALARPAFL
ncbi:class I SAM-dependent methyltransferase [Streptomyces echinoruber]|uniref:Lambda phage type II DNA modification methyltransferase n=1 Tax=Streptomyces echinoruber TaxID=68898 RepID=A0A918V6J3_9ACTN|nr:class I SAM-dependent methyltransferase [Streptomyces echinoruber]GGZ73153.1 lambda phage type II DNA modification methyltransferase [Streptomyces echinoruber]